MLASAGIAVQCRRQRQTNRQYQSARQAKFHFHPPVTLTREARSCGKNRQRVSVTRRHWPTHAACWVRLCRAAFLRTQHVIIRPRTVDAKQSELRLAPPRWFGWRVCAIEEAAAECRAEAR